MSQITHQSLYGKGIWRIVWFGKMTPHVKGSPSSIFINTYLTPVTGNPYQNTPQSVENDTFKVTQVPIGELVRLHIGQIIEDGVPAQASNKCQAHEQIEHELLNFNLANLTVFDRYQKYNDNYVYPKGSLLSDPEFKGENNNLFVGIKVGDNPYHYVIPCVEIFRFFYATSSEMAKELVSDSFLDPSKRLWNGSTATLDEVTREASFSIRKYMLDADAKYLARFAWDKYALERAQEIYTGAAGQLDTQYERMIYARPPIEGEHFTKFISRKLSSGSILIRRIINCSWKPPYDSLEWYRDTQRSNEDTETTPEPTKGSGQGVTNPPPEKEKPTRELNKDKPNSNNVASKISEDEISSRFPNLEAISSTKIIPLSTNPRKKKKKIKVLNSVSEGSVLDGHSEESNAGLAHIEASQPINSNPLINDAEQEGQLDFISVMNHLIFARDYRVASVDFCLVTQRKSEINGIAWNVLPTVEGVKGTWMYLDEKEQEIRKVLIGKVSRTVRRQTITRYLIEIQPKRDGEFSTLVVWSDEASVISQKEFFDILVGFVTTGSAKIDTTVNESLSWGRLRHTTPFTGAIDDTAHFIDRAFKAIEQ